MGKKGKDDVAADEGIRPEDEEEPAEPEILKLCFRTGSQLYYGECKAGFKQRYGTFVRHGFGKLVDAAVSPVGIRPELGQELAYETVVLATYDGRWQDNVLTGPGVVKWSDGSAYEGAFADGQLHGHGRFVWPDGSAYEGAWHQGAMHGQGRFDSRFDGSFLQGRFHQNQLRRAKDGSWVDILEEHRRLEQDSILRVGDWNSVQVKVCELGGCGPDQGQTLVELSAKLEALLAEAQAAGLVPFVLAEASCEESVLKCFRLSGSHPDQCVSLREASVVRRRKRDFSRLFYDAIQASLRSGSRFVMVLEDDDGGMNANGGEGLLARTPSRDTPSCPVPEEWKIPSFFDPDAFPIDVFRPQSFNGRNVAKLFLPEEVKNEQERALRLLSLNPETPLVEAGGEKPKAEEAPPPPKPKAEAKTKGRNSTSPVMDPAEDLEAKLKAAAAEKAAAEVAAREVAAAAAAAAPAGTGLTGHFFGPGLSVSPDAAGLQTAYFLRPAVAATARVPDGLVEAEVRKYIVERYASHVPMHCTMVVLLTAASGDATRLGPLETEAP